MMNSVGDRPWKEVTGRASPRSLRTQCSSMLNQVHANAGIPFATPHGLITSLMLQDIPYQKLEKYELDILSFISHTVGNWYL
jgi:hypothetical protein